MSNQENMPSGATSDQPETDTAEKHQGDHESGLHVHHMGHQGSMQTGGIEMTTQQITEFKETFSLFDKDNSGNITMEELGTAMRSLGQDLSDCELEAMVSELDDDKSGTITFQEFLMLMGKKMAAEANEQEYIEAFKVFDKDGNGTVSAEELRYMMQNHGAYRLTDEEVDEMMADADVDGDGQLQYHEFIKLMLADPT